MSFQRFTLLPGQSAYGSYLQIHIPTADPLDWLDRSRSALAFLLEYSRESDLPKDVEARCYGVRLLTWLFPLRAQWENGVQPLAESPAPTECGGVWFTGEGLALRFDEVMQFEELHSIARALLDLVCCNAYELTEETRAGLFQLMSGILPTAQDVADFTVSQKPGGYTFDKNEQGFASELSTLFTRRAELLRNALATPTTLQNRRFLSALAHLGNEGKISLDLEAYILEYVATGCPTEPGETESGD